MLIYLLYLIASVLNFGLAVHNHSYLSGLVGVLNILTAVCFYISRSKRYLRF